MKTRVNELHEPKIEAICLERYAFGGANIGKFYCATARCRICNYFLSDRNGITKELAIGNVLAGVLNYCPNCGARLKEVGG